MFRSPLVEIGAFRCDRDHPRFHDSGPTEHNLFVFPRTSVVIQHEHERPFVTNAAVVTLYNCGQVYRREPISRRGDCCDWFGVDGALALDVVRAWDPDVEAHPERPFRFVRTACDARTYASQRRLFDTVRAGARLPPYVVEERAVRLLDRVLAHAYAHATADRGRPTPRQRDVVHHVEVRLSERFDEPLSLTDLAAGAQVSPFHLCRSFRHVTGRTLGEYRQELRLRTSLEPLRESGDSITDIALSLGFSSHSHFTRAFRRAFGTSPSAARSHATLRSTR